jgi:hypothetical protein
VKHLTFKNVVLAFVALNILSSFSSFTTSQMVGGTFEHVARSSPPVVRHHGGLKSFEAVSPEIARPAPAAKSEPAPTDPALIAHMFPGEALLPAEMPPARTETPDPPAAAAPTLDETAKPLAKPATAKKPRVSDPPGVKWLMLLMIGAMALYARYVAARMAQNAVWHAVESIKHIASALGSSSNGLRMPSKPAPVARQPAAQPKPKLHPASSRKSTVVRASRWPFAA